MCSFVASTILSKVGLERRWLVMHSQLPKSLLYPEYEVANAGTNAKQANASATTKERSLFVRFFSVTPPFYWYSLQIAQYDHSRAIEFQLY